MVVDTYAGKRGCRCRNLYFSFDFERIIHTDKRRESRDLDTDVSVGGFGSLVDPSWLGEALFYGGQRSGTQC